ncbi:uncharacterized protein [Procambarus clarkii]|uniref:uncharacterized protein n=1 Tax=Procambarus clarkii TaxID=6728 RepID=UPI003744A1D4
MGKPNCHKPKPKNPDAIRICVDMSVPNKAIMHPKKVADIKNAAPPSTSIEIHSFLGMAHYCSRFTPDFATITKPLREILKKNALWYWSNIEQNAFDAVKDALVENATAAYFDPSMYTELTMDASHVSLGAI